VRETVVENVNVYYFRAWPHFDQAEVALLVNSLNRGLLCPFMFMTFSAGVVERAPALKLLA
jgi:hypothetical protein